MPTVTYTAVNRGELIGGHVAGNPYTILFQLEAYPRTRTARGTMEETNDGTPEGWLAANVISWQLDTDLVLESNVGQWEEFFSSVMNGEPWTLDLTGTIAVPVAATTYSVWMPDRRVTRQQVLPRNAKYSFRAQKLP